MAPKKGNDDKPLSPTLKTRQLFPIFPILSIALILSKSVAFSQSPTWKLDNLKKIGGQQIEILGEPKVIDTDKGEAIEFDG